MKKALCAAAVAALAGCATFDDMQSGLAKFAGHPQAELFSVIGYPDGKLDIGGGETVFIWRSASTQTMFMPQTANVAGSVGLKPVYGSVSYTEAVPMHFACEIKVGVNPDGTIRNWSFQGNLGGCEPYIRRLNSYWKARGG